MVSGHVERKPMDERPRREERPRGDVPAPRRVERRSMDKPQWGEAERWRANTMPRRGERARSRTPPEVPPVGR